MSCIQNIVTLGICPDEETPTSGLTLMMAAGISPKNLSNIASDFDVNGITMAMQKKELALTQFRNDFYGALQTNKIQLMLAKTEYDISYFKEDVNKGIYDGYRGIILHKNAAYKGSLRKTYIDSVSVYPLQSGDTTIRIIVGSTEYAYPVTVVASQINTFDSDTFNNFPFEIPAQYENAKIFVDSSEIQFASSYITCKKGCNGSQTNDCGWAEGWDGTKREKHEGFGVNAIFHCECDYDTVICDMAKSFSGELIWLKWQIAIFEEQYKSNRFENWVVYNNEDINKIWLPQLYNDYATKWNQMMAGLLGILRSYNDSCLDCRRIRRLPNI